MGLKKRMMHSHTRGPTAASIDCILQGATEQFGGQQKSWVKPD